MERAQKRSKQAGLCLPVVRIDKQPLLVAAGTIHSLPGPVVASPNFYILDETGRRGLPATAFPVTRLSPCERRRSRTFVKPAGFIQSQRLSIPSDSRA